MNILLSTTDKMKREQMNIFLSTTDKMKQEEQMHNVHIHDFFPVTSLTWSTIVKQTFTTQWLQHFKVSQTGIKQ